MSNEASEQLYYILDARSSVGNCASWWAPGGNGYVCDLAKAGKFTKDEAFGKRDTDVPVPCEAVEAAALLHVRVDGPALDAFWNADGAAKWRRDLGGKRRR